MLKSFFIAALRNLRKNRTYTAINVLGLALGVACCMIIFVMVRFETSFDDFHSKADRIYRINLHQKTPYGLFLEGRNYTPLASAIRKEVTGLEAVTAVYCLQIYQFSEDNNLYEGKYAFFAEPEYFHVFDVGWISGNKELALKNPNSVVVTEAFAEKYLKGMDHALGSTFKLENKIELTVTGVVKSPPANTDHPYSLLISYSTLPAFAPEMVDNWETIGGGATYIVFQKDTRPERIDPQLNTIIAKYLRPEVAKNTKFYLMPLNDNHDRNYDYNNFTYDFPVPVMIILSIIAGMIAFIACINFVNLATALSLNRAREVGIRKTLGSSRRQLIFQYLSEAFVITLLAMVAGTALASFGMNRLNSLYGGEYLQFNFIKTPATLLFMAGITVAITVLAGFYPAFVLSGYRPVWALKAQNTAGKTGFSLRRLLVISQFVGAQLLIIVTLIIINQIDHFSRRPVGYNTENILVIRYLRGNEMHQHARMAQELASVPGIAGYTFSQSTPAGGERVEFYATNSDDKKQGRINYVDEKFLSTFNIPIVAGVNFSTETAHTSSEVLVNESLVESLDFEDPSSSIGTIFTLNGSDVKIRGVFKNFYTDPMSSRVDPVALQFNPDKFSGIAVNIETGKADEAVAGIEKAWKEVYPEFLCRYTFMEDALNRQFGFFRTIFTFMGIASFLAIFIGCLGLYGLVSFMALQRTKEIGIRKVLGATVSNIMIMFTRESVILIVIGFAIAAPLAILFGKAMLMELPERINPGLWTFVSTLLASLFIAMLTVAYRSFTAATQNPTESLRNE